MNALEYFTDREEAIQAFERNVNAAAGEPLRVLVFYGVGGIGKTTLVQKLCADLHDVQPPLPHARFNIENVGDQTQAYREGLFRLRSDRWQASWQLASSNRSTTARWRCGGKNSA